jgi:hypothetical protein
MIGSYSDLLNAAASNNSRTVTSITWWSHHRLSETLPNYGIQSLAQQEGHTANVSLPEGYPEILARVHIYLYTKTYALNRPVGLDEFVTETAERSNLMINVMPSATIAWVFGISERSQLTNPSTQ